MAISGYQKNRIRLRDARDLYAVVGECRALGAEGVGWRQHLVRQCRELFDAEMACFADIVMRGDPWSGKGWAQPISLVDEWGHEEDRHLFWRWVRRGRDENSRMWVLISQALASKSGIRVAARRDVMSEDVWYAHEFFQRESVTVPLDDFVVGVIAGGRKSFQILFMQRRQGQEFFSQRHVHILKAILIELSRLQPDELIGLDNSAFMALPPRVLQVLACLLSGFTVKATAGILGISPHTVQVHVKRLYERSGVSNRAELAECYRHVAAMIVGMTLQDLSDYQRRINEEARKPWLAEPGRAAGEADAGD